MNKFLRTLRHALQNLAEDARGVENPPHVKDERQAGNLTLQNFYSSRAILPQGQSSDQLGGWLSRHHPRYNMSSWCFYGNLTDDAGRTAAISSMVQYQQFPSNLPYVAEWSYCDDTTNGYVVAPFVVEEGNVEYSSPFAITVDYNPVYGGLFALSLDSGRLGERGAKYRMTGRVVVLGSDDEWEYEVLMRDSLGCIQAGYGPSSFLPQWLTHEQEEQIKSSFDGSVHTYLDSGRDEMFAQGSYYYSLPLLAVDRFSISRNGKQHFSGTHGNIWVDYVVQSFDASGLNIVKSATWQFFAVQFPEIDGHPGYQAALMFSKVTVQMPSDSSPEERTSDLPVARFYDRNSRSSENGSLHPTFEWKLDQIHFHPRRTWNGFPIEVEIFLDAPDASVRMIATAVRNNQVVLPDSVNKYEGVFEVRAELKMRGIHVKDVKGFAWGEVH